MTADGMGFIVHRRPSTVSGVRSTARSVSRVVALAGLLGGVATPALATDGHPTASTRAAGARTDTGSGEASPGLPPPAPVTGPTTRGEGRSADTLPGGAIPLATLAAPPAVGASMVQGGGGTGPTFEYYALDALGSVRVVFDAAGAVKARADFEPFGALASTTGPLPPEQFTGQQRDSEVGLDYFGARFYQATHGRMLSVDPLYLGAMGDPQRWNRYAYALNSPTVMTDPDGRVACTGTGSGQGFVGACASGPTINTPSPGQGPLLGAGSLGSLTDPNDYFDVMYGPGYRPSGGIDMSSLGTQAPATGPEAGVIVGQISTDADGNVVLVPDLNPDTSIPIGVASAITQGGRIIATTALIVANRAAGLKFESALGWAKAKGRIVVDGVRTRIPDYYDQGAMLIGEAKNVGYLRLSRQLTDMADWVKANPGWTFEIHTTATKISQGVRDLGATIRQYPRPR